MAYRVPRRVASSIAIELHSLLQRAQSNEPLSPLLAVGLSLGAKSGYEPLRKFCEDEINNDLARIMDEKSPARRIQTIKIPGAIGLGGQTLARTEEGILQEILSQPNAIKSEDLHFQSIATTESSLADIEATEKLGRSVSIAGRTIDGSLYRPEWKGIPIVLITPAAEMRGFLSAMRREFIKHVMALNALLPKWALRVSPGTASLWDKTLATIHQVGVAWVIAVLGPLTLLAIALILHFRYGISYEGITTKP